MAKSKRKQALEARDRKAAKTILRYVIIGTVVFMLLMFLLFKTMN